MIEAGFEEVMVEAIKLHDKKNNDYNGAVQLYKLIGLKGRYSDVFRKVIRLHSLVWEGNERKVKDETIRDTMLDLLVYTVLMIIIFDELKYKSPDELMADTFKHGFKTTYINKQSQDKDAPNYEGK